MTLSARRPTSMAYRVSRRCLGLAVCWLWMIGAANAQPATPTSKLAFDEVGQSVATAGGATYTAFVDGSTTGVPLAGLTCTATTTPVGATCTVALPALTTGAHTLTVTQTIAGASSTPSASLAFSMVLVVTPTNVRIVP